MKKILILIFMTLMSLSFVNGTLNDAQVYYSFQYGNFTDISGNGNTATNFGTTNTTGILDSARSFDGVNDYMTSPISDSSGDWTWNVWVKPTDYSLSTQQMIFSDSDNSNGWYYNVLDTTNDRFRCNGVSHDFSHILTLNTFNFLTITHNDTANEVKLYVDNVLVKTISSCSISNGPYNMFHGRYSNSANLYFNGVMDEISFYTRILTNEQISELYNSGNANNPYSATTPQIQINISDNDIFNISNINVSMTTTSNVNMSIYLNDVLNQTFTNTNSTVAELINLPEQINNLSFKSEDINGINWNNISITNDYTAPTIDIIGNITQQNFEVNFTDIFNVTDALSGIASCTIDITYLENVTNSSQYDKFINCTDTTTFGANGLYNGLVEATDNAGNYNSLSVNGTIQTVVDINFFQPNGSQISDFNYQLLSPNGYTESVANTSNPAQISPFVNGSLDLGNWTLTFEKIGFATTDFIIEIDETSGGEEFNYTIQISRLYLNIYDTDSDNLITQNVDIALVGESFAGTFATSNGTLIIDNITYLPGNYQLTLSSNNYVDLNYFFQHTGYEAVNLSLYMQNENETIPIKYIVQDQFANLRGSSDDYPRCLVQVAEYDIATNSYILQTMDYTNSNGEIIFELDTTKYLKNTVICDEGTFIFSGEKITSTPVILTVGQVKVDYFDSQLNVAYTPINFTILNNETARYSLTYADSNSIVSEACLSVYQRTFNDETFVDEVCLNTATGSLNIDFDAVEGETFIARAHFVYENIQYDIPSRVDYVPVNYEDLGIIGLFITAIIVFALALAGLAMPQGIKWLGVMLGATLGLWIGSVLQLIPMNYYVLTTWTVLLILGAVFS